MVRTKLERQMSLFRKADYNHTFEINVFSCVFNSDSRLMPRTRRGKRDTKHNETAQKGGTIRNWA